MNRKIVLSIVLIAFIGLAVAAWFVQGQFSGFQTEINELQAQNRDLQDQNNALQAQVSESHLQNREQQDRLTDFTYQLALRRHLSVKITAFIWIGGFHPIVGVTISHPVNVTVQNNDVIPVLGLTLTVRLLDKDLGTLIGTEGQRRIDRINAGESQVISGDALTTLNIDGSSTLSDAVCVVSLTVGDIVLDEWKQAI